VSKVNGEGELKKHISVNAERDNKQTTRRREKIEQGNDLKGRLGIQSAVPPVTRQRPDPSLQAAKKDAKKDEKEPAEHTTSKPRRGP